MIIFPSFFFFIFLIRLLLLLLLLSSYFLAHKFFGGVCITSLYRGIRRISGGGSGGRQQSRVYNMLGETGRGGLDYHNNREERKMRGRWGGKIRKRESWKIVVEEERGLQRRWKIPVWTRCREEEAYKIWVLRGKSRMLGRRGRFIFSIVIH